MSERGDLVRMACAYSRGAHQAVKQVRKYTGEPYYNHPARVASLVYDFCPKASDAMIAAAYLHDVVEDTGVSVSELQIMFGPAVADYVWELTDRYTGPEHGNRAQRKKLECERLANISYGAQTIKYADLIDNTASIAKHDSDFAKVYLEEKTAILKAMNKGESALLFKAWDVLIEATPFGEAKT